MGYKQHLTRGAVVALLVLTVFGMTAAPVMANSTTATNDCDLVDIDGDDNEVSVNMEDSEVNINCGDGGDIGGSDTADTGSDADTGDEAMTVHVNGDEVDVSEQQDAEQQDAEVQNVENDAGDQNVESGAGDQNVENDAGDQSVEDDEGDQNVESGEGDQNQESGDGDQNVESGEGDQLVGGPGDDVQQDFTADEILSFLIQQNFIDQDEVNAAIGNGVSNSTIVANILNGDGTIDQSSTFVVDNSETFIDNSTRIVFDNDSIMVVSDDDTNIENNTVNDNDTDVNVNVSDDDTNIENNTVNDNDTNINESGNGSVETGDGDQNVGNNDTDDMVGNDTDGMNATAPDINVTKTASDDEVELSLLPGEGGILQANDPVTFTVTVTNEGNATANDVVVNDDDVIADIEALTDTTAFVVLDSSTSQGDFSAVTGDFEVGTLAPGDSATLTFSALAVSTDAELLDGDEVLSIDATNDAALTSVSPDDPNGGNDADSTTVTLVSLLDGGLPGPLSGQETSTTTDTVESTTGTAENGTNASALLNPMNFAFGGLGLVGVLGSVLLLRRD